MSTENQSNSSAAVLSCYAQASLTADYELFNQISLGPALAIIFVLALLKKRANLWKDCCDGRPGIQVPVDFLGDEQNRFSYAFGYGAMAVGITNMFFNNAQGIVFTIKGPPYITVFQAIITVICIGTIYLPFFMCLSTNAKILGAVLGFAYTVGRFAGLARLTVKCHEDPTSKFVYWPLFFDLPALLCHFMLVVRFAVIIVKELMDKCFRKKASCRVLLGAQNDFEIGQHYVDHVKTLLQGVSKRNDNKWYIKGRNFVYTPEPHFKYSVAILSTVIVAGIIIYEIVIVVVGIFIGWLITFRDSIVDIKEYYVFEYGQEQYDVFIKFLNILLISIVVSCVVSALFMFFQMYRMLVAHRNHVIKLIKSDRRFLPNKLATPDAMVGMSLRFCGYQIAYFLWGFIILLVVLLILVTGISAAILFLPMLMGDQLNKTVSNIAIAMIPTVGMAMFIFLMQQILARLVFKDRSFNSRVVHVDNRRCYLLISFFFFFFNVLVGFMSCMLRIIKGIILGVLFIGRIDRPLIMKGFTNFDSAYVAYIGFLHLQAAHKHPVVLAFSHLLWTGARRTRAERMKSSSDVVVGNDNTVVANGWTELREDCPRRPRVSASALNKWFIAVTVIRNPTLIYNRKGFLKHILLGIPSSPTPSIDGDVQPTTPEQHYKDADTEHSENNEETMELRKTNEKNEKIMSDVINV